MYAAIGMVHPSYIGKHIKEYKDQWIYYRNDRELWQGSTSLNKQGKGFKAGETVTLTWDPNNGEIEWKVKKEIRYKYKWPKLEQEMVNWLPCVYLFTKGDHAIVTCDD